MPTPKSGYFLKDGTKVPGVTTILGRWKDSGGLLFWAFDQGKAAQRGEIQKLYDNRDSAAASGTLAHLLVEKHINGEPEPDLAGYPEKTADAARQGFENYLRWEGDNKIEILYQELQLVSEEHGFGGSPDAIGTDSRGQTTLLDWKTSSGGPYVDWLLQLSAYRILWLENYPSMPITGGIHLLRFSKENADFHHHFWQDLSEAEELFLLLRKAYDLDKRLKKRL
jgi:hypothetical protein